MGSDYLVSLADTKASISATEWSANQPLSREAHGRSRPHNREQGGRSRFYGAPALFVLILRCPLVLPLPAVPSTQQTLLALLTFGEKRRSLSPGNEGCTCCW